MTDFELSSYDFDLPESLIASRPVPDRHSSKLMVYNHKTNQVTHSTFREIGRFLPAESTLVFNRSRVFPCRLLGHKTSGGEAEVFVLSLLEQEGIYSAFIRASGKRKEGEIFVFGNIQAKLEVVKGDGTFLVSFNLPKIELLDELERIGKIPIPPYIRGGESDDQDKEEYQTVFAEETGSVAAPTAGLHFSDELLTELKSQGHQLSTVTLHVGAGTFAPVKSHNILEHKMHSEYYSIDEVNLNVINKAKFRVAVGTTTLRTLESSWKEGRVEFEGAGLKSTDIFLHPGKQINSIDGLVTNFHLPKSSLLMLVSSLVGREKMLSLYQEAISHHYRFYSYGDGMLILR